MPFLCYYDAFSQGCPESDVILNHQSQIDSFPINYPGCNVISGNLTIEESGPDTIFNLNGLLGISNINGNLEIKECYYLENLSGLSMLQKINGTLDLSYNYFLPGLDGLETLDTIQGDLRVNLNHKVQDFTVFNNLQYIGGEIVINWNNGLTSLAGLQNIKINKGITLTNNSKLSDISIFESTDTIHGDLIISCNWSLHNLNSFHNIHSIEGSVDINSCEFTNLSGLDNLTFIGNDLILEMSDFTTLQGLNSLRTVGGSLKIGQNTSLTDLSSLINLQTIEGTLNISDNTMLMDISSLENINENSIQMLEITGNYFLADCAIESICNYLLDENAPSLIENNYEGCNSRPEIEQKCKELNNLIPDNSNLTIYPIPVTDILTITYNPYDTSCEIRIVDAQGNLALKFKIDRKIEQIDISELSSGLYFLTCVCNGHEYSTKFVKL